jgi:hypothetical protein
MKFFSRYLLSYLLVLAPILTLTSSTTVTYGQAEEPVPVSKRPLFNANNFLRNTNAEDVPELQSGYGNDGDLWLLYDPAFDQLSGNAQSMLMRKYGLTEDILFTKGSPAPVQAESAADAHNAAIAKLEAAPERVLGSGNRQVNDPDLDVRTGLQSEVSVAAAGNNIVVGYNEGSLAGFGSGISYSRDGGRTWKQTVPPLLAFGSGIGDPVMAAGPGGVFYFMQMGFNSLGNWFLAVSRSTDGGARWSTPVNAVPSLTIPSNQHDKPWMTVDNSNSPFRGSIYLTWTRFASTAPSSIFFVKSTDGGRTWSTPRAATPSTGTIQGSMPAVGPNGELYVTYWDNRIPGLAVVKSTDGGETFSAPVTALRDPSLRFGRHYNGSMESPPFPSITVDTSNSPFRGTVYIATDVKPTAAVARRDEADVVVVRSTNGGATWSAPVIAADDPFDTDQFMPAVAVAANGTLGVMYYDRRNDPINNVLHDVYISTSSDGGRSFTPGHRITPGNWLLAPTPSGFRAGYHGDYNQIVASDNGFVLGWGDERNGLNPDVYAHIIRPEDAATPNEEFNLFPLQPAQSVPAGLTATFDLKVDVFDSRFALPNNPAASASSTVEGADGLRYSFSRADAQTLNLRVTATRNVASGTYPITVKLTINGVEHWTTVRLNVASPFDLAQAPQALTSLRESHYVPDAVADAQNDLHVVTGVDTRRGFSTFGGLVYTRFRHGYALQTTPIASESNPDVRLEDARVGVDDAGNITISWIRWGETGVSENIFMRRSTDGGATFSAPISLSRNTTGALVIINNDLAVGRNGSINSAFDGFDLSAGALRSVFFVRSTDGGTTLSPRLNVSSRTPTTVQGLTPAIAVDAADAVSIAYDGISSTGQRDIFFTRSTNGTTFSPPLNLSRILSTSTTVLADSPSTAIDGAGNINIAFSRRDLTRNEQEIYFCRSTNNGTSFSPAVNVTRTTVQGTRSFAPHIGVDARGNIGISAGGLGPGIIFPGGRDVIFVTSSDGGASFSPFINASTNIGLQLFFPVTVTDWNGNLATIWADETGGTTQVMLAQPRTAGP